MTNNHTKLNREELLGRVEDTVRELGWIKSLALRGGQRLGNNLSNDEIDVMHQLIIDLKNHIASTQGGNEVYQPTIDRVLEANKEFAEYNRILREENAALKALPRPNDGVEEKWYGYAGHLVVGSRCAYHLSTRIGGYLISTVGDFRPDGRIRDTIGAGSSDFFETMVFKCDGEDKNGDPNILDWSAIECQRYAESLEAEKGHYVFLDKYRSLPPTEEPPACQ